MKALRWIVLWPLIVRAGRVLSWLFPPLGFVLWRLRVGRRREALLRQAAAR
jgi:hypothetical protein